MPINFPSHIYYHSDHDQTIPRAIGRESNIILTVRGMQEIAEHYKEKHGVDITPFAATDETAPKIICDLIDNIRVKTAHLKSYQCGFMFLDVEAGQHGHALPLIWQKNGDEESLFFLDSGQWLGNTAYDGTIPDYISMPTFNNETDLSILPGKSNTAYIRTAEKFFFIRKNSNERKEIKRHPMLFSNETEEEINAEMLRELKKYENSIGIPENEFTQLTKPNLKQLEAITHNHIHYIGKDGWEFRRKIHSLIPNIEFWSHIGARQIDMSSCTTDAMVILKDGLRLPSLAKEAELKFVKKESDVNLFYMPEKLLKTAQIGSFPEKSKADSSKVIHFHNIKDKTGKKTGESLPVTLGMFRQKYDKPTQVSGEIKSFGTYTLQKGDSYSSILRKRWEQKQAIDIQKMLSILTVNQENFNKSPYLDVLRNELSDNSKKHLAKICDYLSIMINHGSHYSTDQIKQAQLITELLISAILDKSQPNMRANLEKLVDPRSYTYGLEPNAEKFARDMLSKVKEYEALSITPKVETQTAPTSSIIQIPPRPSKEKEYAPNLESKFVTQSLVRDKAEPNMDTSLNFLRNLSEKAGIKSGQWQLCSSGKYTYSMIVSYKLYKLFIEQLRKIIDPENHGGQKSYQAASIFVKATQHESDNSWKTPSKSAHLEISVNTIKLSDLIKSLMEKGTIDRTGIPITSSTQSDSSSNRDNPINKAP